MQMTDTQRCPGISKALVDQCLESARKRTVEPIAKVRFVSVAEPTVAGAQHTVVVVVVVV